MYCPVSASHTPETFFSSVYWSVMRSFWAVCTAAAAALWEAAPEPAGAAGAAAPPQPVSQRAAARTTVAKHLCFMGVLLSIKPRTQGECARGKQGDVLLSYAVLFQNTTAVM